VVLLPVGVSLLPPVGVSLLIPVGVTPLIPVAAAAFRGAVVVVALVLHVGPGMLLLRLARTAVPLVAARAPNIYGLARVPIPAGSREDTTAAEVRAGPVAPAAALAAPAAAVVGAVLVGAVAVYGAGAVVFGGGRGRLWCQPGGRRSRWSTG
jgi:hypothetical protein